MARAELRVYSYNGRSDVAAKALPPPLLTVNIAPPDPGTNGAGAVAWSPLGGDMTVNLWAWTTSGERANYAEIWQYNSDTATTPSTRWCYWCEEVSTAGGLATIRLTPDALSTCYRNGALDTYALCARSTRGNQEKLDPMMAREAYGSCTIYHVGQPIDVAQSTYALVVATASGIPDHQFSPRVGCRVYLMSWAAAWQFTQVWGAAVTETDRKRFAPSIMAFYRIPMSPGVVMREFIDVSANVRQILMPDVAQKQVSDSVVMTLAGEGSYFLREITDETPLPTQRNGLLYEYALSAAGSSIRTSGDRQDAVISVTTPFGDRISFTGHASNVNAITSLAAFTRVDLSSGAYRTHLKINGTERQDLAAAGVITEQIPIISDAAVQTWVTWKGDSIRAAMSMAGSVASGVSAGAVMGGVGGAVLGGIGGAISGATRQGGNMLAAGADRVANDAVSPPTISGVLGGSIVHWYNVAPYVMVTATNYYGTAGEQSNFHALFGYPDGIVRALSTLGGYVQTVGATLKASSLPRVITAEAERMLDAGCYISDPL